MRLFLSYARKDKAFCTMIAGILDAHEVWFDERLWAGEGWWRQILRMLDWCNAFIYILSKDSVESDYCRREYELARKAGRIIIPVVIDADLKFPEKLADLAELHYVDFSMGLNLENQRALLNAIVRAEREMSTTRRKTIPSAPTGERNLLRPPALLILAESDPNAALAYSMELLRQGKYDEALMLLDFLIKNGLITSFYNLERHRNFAERRVNEQTREREIERNYRNIVEMLRQPETRTHGIVAIGDFHRDNPDYDPLSLVPRLRSRGLLPQAPSRDRNQPLRTVTPQSEPFRLPGMNWLKIPSGSVIVQRTTDPEAGEVAAERIDIPTFYISKYPITNAQYQVFVNDPDGYNNPRWWNFSPHAHQWRLMHAQASPGQFSDDQRPRETVTWYEAMAFCEWLSAKMGRKITLPLRQQWQRAARGDDNRLYPWGNHFSPECANTSESGLRQTTVVNQYQMGASPFGVMDMAGNCWEWCLNMTYDDCDPTADTRRAVQGGSYNSNLSRVQIDSFLLFAPESPYSSVGFRVVCVR